MAKWTSAPTLLARENGQHPKSPGHGWRGGGALVAWCGWLAGACSAPAAPPTPAEANAACMARALSPAPLRRLTRFEYVNTVRDVFGSELALEELLPRDEVALGFDDQAGTLSVSDLHVEGYLEAAESVAEWVVAEPARVAALGGCSDSTPECARELVAVLSQRLERRPLAEAEIDSLLELFAGDFSAAGINDGVANVISALLEDPHFLYRLERSAAESAQAGSLASPWLLASRLSFLLWGSGPDAALLERAAQGQLTSAADVEREARRLLDDVRARRGVLHFYTQWLNLSDFAAVEKDRRRFPIWNDALQVNLGLETSRFIEGVLWDDDARFETLLTAPYTFANAALEDYYDLPISAPDSEELQRIDFAAGTPRAGLLTQGSILSTQAKPDQTDPIHRGKFIRERFFCDVPPPPPPNLAVIPPALVADQTTRARFEQHRTDPSCAGCHAYLDPVGLVFEHYDAIGQYRATEAETPIDASGYIQGSDVEGAIDGVPALTRRLTQSADVRHCVIKHWFRYAFGRGETDTDSCTLVKLDRTMQESDGNLRELLIALTQTAAFLRPSPAPALEAEESP